MKFLATSVRFQPTALVASFVISLLASFAASSIAVTLTAAAAEPLNVPFAQRQKVPPFPQGITWLNTTGPIELRDLRGKFVVFDFWTYCCINCMHILPELHKLELAYPKNLVVIGIHSAKFTTERDSENITAAIHRYKIEHPVINDAKHELWNFFHVDTWPTLMLIDPEGNVVWRGAGEEAVGQIDRLVRTALPYYRKHRLLEETPLRFNVALPRATPTPLRYPGKILADEANDRLIIADSNHNRIVIARLDGTAVAVVGSGISGGADGDFVTAQFNQPQGIALRGNAIYVADTENHSIRRIDLAARKVRTIAGTGRQSHEPGLPGRRLDPRRTPLCSPWDVCVHGPDLYIAMAGCHQIWKMRLDNGPLGVYAGNGREDVVDGALLPFAAGVPGSASFAQPSGLATDGTWLYVADSEGSSIRAVPLGLRGEVKTIVGTARLSAERLFTFGDVDGPGSLVRLQHPLGLASAAGRLYVADTYNSKIRVLDPISGATETLAGSGKSGDFFEPGGLSVVSGKVFVADTNNHRIRVIDLQTSSVSTLDIAGLKPPRPPDPTFDRTWDAEESHSPEHIKPEGNAIQLRVELELAPGLKINPLAPMSYRITASVGEPGDKTLTGPLNHDNFDKETRIEKPSKTFDIRVPVTAQTGRESIEVLVNYYYCREGAEGLCMSDGALWPVQIDLSPDGQPKPIVLRHRVR